MKEFLLNIFEIFTILDFIFLFFIIINSLLGFNSGFALSLISFLKWVFAIILTVIILPIFSPYTKDLINSEFAHDMVFGSIIFILSIFFIIIFSKGIKKTLNWTGFGGVDKFFGLIFGLIKGYVYFIVIFTLLSFIHPYEKWNKNFNEGKFFEIIFSGKQFLEENLPKRYEYIDKSKEKVNKITK